jgi:Tetratricopeptide repeat
MAIDVHNSMREANQHPHGRFYGVSGRITGTSKRPETSKRPGNIHAGRVSEPIDTALDWMLDRAADAIDAEPEPPDPRKGSEVRQLLTKTSDRLLEHLGGRGAWTAGLGLLEKRRWQAASVAFKDAVRGFEREVGHDHMWTAHALAREGWCYLKLGRYGDALPVCREAYDIALRQRPGALDVLRHFRELVEIAENRQSEGNQS